MAVVFISYRRGDTSAIAARLADTLTRHLGDQNVYRDIDRLEPGTPFPNALESAIAQTDALLVVIGPDWSSEYTPPEEGVDWVHREIGLALKAGKRVVPVLVGGAELPKPASVPEEIRPFLQGQAIRIEDEGWDDDVRRMLRGLRFSTLQDRRRKRRAILLSGLALVLIGVVVLIIAATGTTPTTTTTPLVAVTTQEPASTTTTSTPTTAATLSRPVPVPDVSESIDPVAVLKAAGLVVIQLEAVDSSVPPGTVISQVPSAGTFVPAGSEVTLTISTTQAGALVLDAGSVGFRPALRIGDDGLPLVAYHDTGNERLMILHCRDLGCENHDSPRVLDDGPVGGRGFFGQISMEIDPTGQPTIAYAKYVPPSADRSQWLKEVRLVVCENVDCSRVDSPTTVRSVTVTDLAGGADHGIDPASGRVYIAYAEPGTGGRLMVTVCDDLACAAPQARVLDAGLDIGPFISLAISPQGLPAISYEDQEKQTLRLALCRNPDCSSPVTTVLQKAGRVGRQSAAGYAPTGDLVVVFFGQQQEEQGIEILRCLDESCQTHTTPLRLDAGEGVGTRQSLSFDDQGRPIVSYFASEDSSLRLGGCEDEKCSRAISPITLDDGSHRTGDSSSLLIDESGAVLVAYFDGSEDDGQLKFIRCRPAAELCVVPI